MGEVLESIWIPGVDWVPVRAPHCLRVKIKAAYSVLRLTSG